MPFRPLTRLVLLALLALGLSACSFSLAEDIVPPANAAQPVSLPTETAEVNPVYPVVPPDPSAGQALFAEECAPCHGDLGLGDGPRANQLSVPVTAIGLPEVARLATPAEWFTIVTQGNLERFMPPFLSLTDRQRWDVVAYAFTLSEKADAVASGETLYQDNCTACHGDLGLGDGPMAANLTNDLTSFTNQAYMAEQSAEGMYQAIVNGKGEMPAYANKLTEDESRTLAAYVRTLSFAGSQASQQTAAPTSVHGLAITGSITSTLPLSVTFGTVSVEVSNASGSELPGEMAATIYAFDNMQITFSQTLSTHTGGVFTFTDVALPPQRVFVASVDYQGTTYSSDVLTVEDPSQPLSLPVTIYETTTDPSGLVVDRAHLFFDFSKAGTVQVVELFIVSNPTQQAVVAEEAGGPVLAYLLPNGYANLQFEDSVLGERYVEIPGGFADTQSIPPGTGQYQVVFAFDLPYNKKLKFEQPLNLGTNASVVLLPDVGIKVKSDELVDAGSRDVQGTNYLMYNGGVLPPGGTLTLELSGSPSSGGSTSTSVDSRTGILIGIGALGLALIGVGVWLFLRNRAADSETADADAEETVQEEDNPDTLMDAIIALDDLYREGKLPEEAYQARRQELKARLEKLVQA